MDSIPDLSFHYYAGMLTIGALASVPFVAIVAYFIGKDDERKRGEADRKRRQEAV